MEKKDKRGGKREGAGAKPKAEILHANAIMVRASKKFFSSETDDEAKEKLALHLLTFERGIMFVAEHVFGKPVEQVNNTHTLNDFNIKEAFKFKK